MTPPRVAPDNLATYVSVHAGFRYLGSQFSDIGYRGIERFRNGRNASKDAIKTRFGIAALLFA